MAIAWTLTHGATTQSLAAWGIENPVLERRNLGVETFSFAIPQADPYADPIFAYDDEIILRRDSTIWFIGRVRDLPAAVSASAGRHRYVVANAWQRVQSIIYQQRYTLATADYTGLIGSWSSRVVLGRDQWGKPMDTEAVIEAVGSYLSKTGGGLSISASLPSSAVPPVETVRDISCAEVIRRMLAYTPDAVGWFDYSSGSTVLTIQRRSALTPVELDLDDEDEVELIDGLTPLNEAQPRGVVIVFVHTEEDGDDVPRLRETRQVAGSRTGPRVVFATVNLAPGETAPTGLASQYYGALSTLQWAGTLRLHGLDAPGTLRPGHVLNLAGGRTAWATMAATVQATTEELFTGLTTVELGHAGHLGLGDFVDMMRRWRERPPAGEFPLTQHNGTEGIDAQETDTDPSEDSEDEFGPSGEDPEAETPEGNDQAAQPAVFPTVDIAACVGGEDKTLRVVGTVISDPA